MMRPILAVVIAWVVIAALVMVAFFVGPVVLGTDRMLAEGTHKASFLWNVCSAIIGIVSATAGGFVCRSIARTGKPVIVLACLIAVMALPSVLRGPDPEPPSRPAHVTGREAMEQMLTHRHEPMITRVLNVVIGAGGVLLGAALARRRERDSSRGWRLQAGLGLTRSAASGGSASRPCQSAVTSGPGNR